MFRARQQSNTITNLGSINEDTEETFQDQVEPFLITSTPRGTAAYSKVKLTSVHDLEPSATEKFRLGCCYVTAMGICGLILVAIASNLNVVAENCGSDFVNAGTVFIGRGLGAVIGTLVSAKLYATFPGNETIASALFIVVLMLIAIPSCHSLRTLHFYFFMCGLGTAITDTGCQIMTRKIFTTDAGPWLGANTIAFGLSGAIVPLVEMTTDDLYVQYLILAALSLASVVSLWLGPDMEGYENFLRAKLKLKLKDSMDSLVPHYRVELIISSMVFFLVGGKVAITAYLNDYVSETEILPEDMANVIILALWISIGLGRVVGVVDQRNLNDETCPLHLSFLLCGSTLGMCLIIANFSSSSRLWIGVVIFGFFNGPCIGYCYDLLNRVTYPTELSTSIVMFGVNVGASWVPYLVPFLWGTAYLGPRSLMIVVLMCCMVPIPLLYSALYCRYQKAFT